MTKTRIRLDRVKLEKLIFVRGFNNLQTFDDKTKQEEHGFHNYDWVRELLKKAADVEDEDLESDE